MNSITELEARLAAAQDAERQAIQRWQDGQQGADEEWDRIEEALLDAERALASARSEEHALPCHEFPNWCVGAPMPHVLARGGHTKLVYVLSEPDPAWDGTCATIASRDEANPLAIVDFQRCAAVKFGGPNDEVMRGHPLHGKGLGAYKAHIVARSRWIAELQQINSVHSIYSHDSFTSLRHYVLVFHDDLFECIAESVVIETVRDKLTDVLRRLV